MAPWTQAILAIWVLWGAIWLAAWLWADRTVARPNRWHEAPYRLTNLLAFAALFGDGALPAWRMAPLWRTPPAIGWALATAALAAMLLGMWARCTLGRLWSAAVTRKAGHRIVAEGPYALTRHPIYTALIGGALALALAKATPVALLGAGLIALGYTLKARVEERFLAAELGHAAYRAYAARVPMLVPFARAGR